jgi:hypothetical protein
MSNASVEDNVEVKDEDVEEQQEETKEEGVEKIEDKEEGETASADSAPIAPAPQAIQPVAGGVPQNPFAHYPPYQYPFPGGGPFADFSQQQQTQSVNYVDASHLPDPPPDTRRNRGGVTEPFPEKLHRMLENAEMVGKADVVSFFPHGRAFAIHKPRRFVSEIMPKFFRQSRMTSFQRQLNLYGFRRISQGPDNGGYYHELFLKGRSGLCVNMKRTKVKGTSKLKRDPESEPNFYVMRGVGPMASMGLPIVPPAALSAAPEGNSSVTPAADDAVENTVTPGEDTKPGVTEPAQEAESTSAPESAAPVPTAVGPVMPAGMPPGYPYAYPYPPYHLPPHMMAPPYTVAQSPLSGDGYTPSQTPGAHGQPIAMYPPYGPPPPYPYAAYYTPWGVPAPPYVPGVPPAAAPVTAAPTAETAPTEEDAKKSEEGNTPSPESDPVETTPAESAAVESTSAENTASV